MHIFTYLHLTDNLNGYIFIYLTLGLRLNVELLEILGVLL